MLSKKSVSTEMEHSNKTFLYSIKYVEEVSKKTHFFDFTIYIN
jgi:hypothetical protein